MTTPNSNINPLDLITAMFLCSDGFLQQEMVLKMSICQFAVPLLLPNCETKQSTLTLWAMRDVVKKFRTSQTATKSFVETRVVLSDMPMLSFVRLGESRLPKSQTLNKLLTNPQDYYDTYIHRNMAGGNVQREISDALVEISWYLPCGDINTDVFKKPVAMANLRGDIRAVEVEFSFLCQTSAAVYIFCDDIEAAQRFLKGKNTEAEIFLVVNSQIDFKTDSSIKNKNVISKENLNDAEFVCSLQSTMSKIIDNRPKKVLSLESMAAMARQCGILVDEDCRECKEGKRRADEITSMITDTLKFKEEQLPLHGKLWKEISQLEKECCRLQRLGDEDIEKYKSSLSIKVKELRKKQQDFSVPTSMEKLLHAMSTSQMKCSYFLKWMRINLDNLSRRSLTDLRTRYKELCQNSPVKKEEIVKIDKQMSDCSLGLEHFLRELGQLYESACSLPEHSTIRQQMEHLPKLRVQLMLGGFPIELVDGDASNILMKWISAVLTELHQLVGSKSKIRVVTVSGVQSSGKSTLLNTMFGVQFAVSTGRCTRGAFMMLLGVGHDLKAELKGDFIMVIDTEGLKSPELAQLEDSYEHDNKLATLVIGLSDVTIINIAMENSTEMKDILQIVVHAFIRMKEVGKRPVCHFVHQNVSDMYAYDNNMRDRKKLLEQLNEMTVAAAKMENKENISKFTDVLLYDPDANSCYIPGLWHGTPPMAPVSARYSEAVYELKKTLIDIFKESQTNEDLTGLQKWIEDLWNAVQFETFIFSFQNTLVAEAYAKLCTTYNGWAWSFQKDMLNWMLEAETEIANIDMTNQTCNTNQGHTMKKEALLSEATQKLTKGEHTIQENLQKYFDNKDAHTHLVEKYKEGFGSSIKTLRMETENTVRVSLQSAVEIREGKTQVENIRSSQASTMQSKVLELLKNCREVQAQLSENELEAEFDIMWRKTLSEINKLFKAKQTIGEPTSRLF
ncbi:up-regulator of cell proliferation-like [Aplochiton taeniatus]